MKYNKFLKYLIIALILEIVAVPVIAVVLSNSACNSLNSDAGTCGLEGFGAVFMIFPIALTIVAIIMLALNKAIKTKFKSSRHTGLWVLLGFALIFAVCFQLYFQSLS
jgi:uncharacterized membrane protein